jgi:branched-chain amino acid aminotransferase
VIVYLNGSWLDEEVACIPIRDPAFLLGHAVFETGRLHRGGFFRFDAHYRRFAAGARTLRLDAPPAAELRDIARELARRTGLGEGTLRITRSSTTLLVTLAPLAPDWRERAAGGWAIVTAAVRHPPPESLPDGVKTPGRLHGLLARFEAADARADDALLLATDGAVTEGPTWNVFWRRGDRVLTPATDVGVLEGVTRAIILDFCRDLGCTVEEGRFPRGELDAADEIFASMTSLGIVPFRELDGRPLPTTGGLASRLQERYWQLVAEEVAGGV